MEPLSVFEFSVLTVNNELGYCGVTPRLSSPRFPASLFFTFSALLASYQKERTATMATFEMMTAAALAVP